MHSIPKSWLPATIIYATKEPFQGTGWIMTVCLFTPAFHILSYNSRRRQLLQPLHRHFCCQVVAAMLLDCTRSKTFRSLCRIWGTNCSHHCNINVCDPAVTVRRSRYVSQTRLVTELVTHVRKHMARHEVFFDHVPALLAGVGARLDRDHKSQFLSGNS